VGSGHHAVTGPPHRQSAEDPERHGHADDEEESDQRNGDDAATRTEQCRTGCRTTSRCEEAQE
jgi:hypothetical protein